VSDRLIIRRHDYGRIPGVAYDGTRYGVAQREPGSDDPDWYGAWPSYPTPEPAEESVKVYRRDVRKYEFAVVEFPAEDPVFAHRMERA
jgi:hypothetical protein